MKGIHFVFITDEEGISAIFSEVKVKLVKGQNNDISIIYLSHNNRFALKKDLDALKRCFPGRFMIYYENNKESYPTGIELETLEVILNTNTKETVHFSLAGNNELVSSTHDQLLFLGVNEEWIDQRFFKID